MDEVELGEFRYFIAVTEEVLLVEVLRRVPRPRVLWRKHPPRQRLIYSLRFASTW
jgi:hypothetical protein